nr:RecName: Full=Seminal plasma protein PDC-109; AltName: Full=BSP-A1 and BSP-A2; AltName: Full=Seminal vesicle secretory protein 109; Short=SVSP109 [Bos indicus]
DQDEGVSTEPTQVGPAELHNDETCVGPLVYRN